MNDNKVSNDELQRAVPHVHAALEGLLRAWDAVREVEKIVGFEITTDELAYLAAGLDEPESVRRAVTPEIVREWLEEVAVAAK